MLLRLSILSFLLSLFLPNYSAIASTDPELAITNIPLELFKNAHSIVRIEHFDFKVKSAGKATFKYRYAVTLLNDNSRENEQYVYYNDLRKVKKVKIRMLDAYGKEIRKIKKDEIRDLSAVSGGTIYSDSRIKYIKLVHDTYPYTIDFEYEVELNGIQTYPSWNVQSFNTSVQEGSYTLRLPSGFDVKYKAYNCDLKPETRTDGDDKIMEWKVKDLSAIKSEPMCPRSRDLFPRLAFAPQVFEVEGYTGSMSSWKDFGTFMYRLNKGRDALSPEMATEVQEMIDKAETDSDKIKTLYRYLQKNMRYVSVQLGIGGWQTFDADYVEENKFGDCKALTNFMKGMLTEVGIESHTALVDAGQNYRVAAEDFATPEFNHVILYVPTEDTWLECTSTNAPANYLGTFTSGRNVLLVTGEGGELVSTPTITAADNFQLNEAEIKIAADGSAQISTQQRTIGPKHEKYRFYWQDHTEKERQDAFTRAHDALPAFVIKNMQLNVEEDKPEANLTYQLEVKRYAAQAGKRIFVPINCLNAFEKVPAIKDGRQHPVVLNSNFSEEDQFTFHLPEGYQVESVPEKELSLDTDFGRYEIKIEEEKGLLRYSRKLEIKPVNLPAERFSEIRDFYKKINKMDKMKVVLVKKKKIIKP